MPLCYSLINQDKRCHIFHGDWQEKTGQHCVLVSVTASRCASADARELNVNDFGELSRPVIDCHLFRSGHVSLPLWLRPFERWSFFKKALETNPISGSKKANKEKTVG